MGGRGRGSRESAITAAFAPRELVERVSRELAERFSRESERELAERDRESECHTLHSAPDGAGVTLRREIKIRKHMLQLLVSWTL